MFCAKHPYKNRIAWEKFSLQIHRQQMGSVFQLLTYPFDLSKHSCHSISTLVSLCSLHSPVFHCTYAQEYGSGEITTSTTYSRKLFKALLLMGKKKFVYVLLLEMIPLLTMALQLLLL